VARWTACAKWGEAPALDGQRDTPLALRLSEGLGLIRDKWLIASNSNAPIALEPNANSDVREGTVSHSDATDIQVGTV